MNKVYKIHPAIGVARVGKHPDAFFVGPEQSGLPGIEINADDSEVPVSQYKKDGLLKKQAARYRVYEYSNDEAGNTVLLKEITADQARIDWTVDLVNRKAALDHSLAPGHPAGPRNIDITDRSTLVIRNPQPQTISGKRQSAVEFHGQFLSIQDVYLGELRTDNSGRLLVLGGRGISESDPVGADLPEFANNDRWHDDVSDGPVTATVTFEGQAPIVVHGPAWVVVAPPDFAPVIDGIVTLYDWTIQAAIDGGMAKPAVQTSFRQHIQSVIQRAANLRWVNNWSRWNSLLPLDWNALSDTGAASAALRRTVGTRLMSPGLHNFIMPSFLKRYISDWMAGNFQSDLGDPDPVLSEPEALDRASLKACIGANFFPGIEATSNIADKDMYLELGRLNPAAAAKVYPGCLTQYMAVPWQADFNDCEGAWWPSQRPDIAMLDKAQVPGSQVEWANPIADHKGMVDNVQRLGFIVPLKSGDETVFVETERDNSFQRNTP